jgi:hypothetical protein
MAQASLDLIEAMYATAEAAQPITHQRQANGDPDRAAVVTASILRIVRRALRDWIDGDGADFAATRGEIETLLRSEFTRIERPPPALVPILSGGCKQRELQ